MSELSINSVIDNYSKEKFETFSKVLETNCPTR